MALACWLAAKTALGRACGAIVRTMVAKAWMIPMPMASPIMSFLSFQTLFPVIFTGWR